MKTRLLLLPAAAVLALVVLGATGGRITTGEAWKGFQEQYLAQWRAKGGTGTPPPVEIKQDRLLGFGEDRIDRCRSCHVAVDDPLFVDGTQPLRTHPPIAPHAFNGMGCTICHEGDGRALTADLAHGKDRFWVEPMLTGQFIESSCARCHPAPYPAEAKHLQRGRALYQQLPCYGCHQVQGLSRGTLGIELTDVGLKRDVKFFKEKLTNPLFNVIATVMPKLNLTEQDKDDLATFLKSLKGRQLAEDPMSYRRRVKAFDNEKPAEVAISVEVGKHSVETRGCLSCHKLGSVDGQRAPDLSFEGQVREASWIEAHLLDPRQHEPNSIMPNFWMSTSERKAIATFLTSLGGLQKPATPKEQYELLCTRCHGEKGGGDGVVAQSLLPRPRVFTNARFFNWLPEARAYNAIRNGVPGTAMPTFGKILDDQDAVALFAWVRKNFIAAEREPITPRKIPPANPIAFSDESVQRARAIFLDRCYGCHGRIGNGKGPNAAEMLPRPRNLTNHEFFKQLPDTRLYESITYGVVGTGMPPWDILTDDQRWDLVNYVRSLSFTGPAAQERRK
jgi:mono/diheme cytochrome c family protein